MASIPVHATSVCCVRLTYPYPEHKKRTEVNLVLLHLLFFYFDLLSSWSLRRHFVLQRTRYKTRYGLSSEVKRIFTGPDEANFESRVYVYY